MRLRPVRAARRTPTNLKRQQDKIVAAINESRRRRRLPGGDRELRRSSARRPGRRPGQAGRRAERGGRPSVWAYVRSPAQPTPAAGRQDVIRTAFIYKKAVADRSASPRSSTTAPRSRNARKPLAQAFKPVGARRMTRRSSVDRQPLQVQGLRRDAGRHRQGPGRLQPGPHRPGQGPAGVRRRSRRSPRAPTRSS